MRVILDRCWRLRLRLRAAVLSLRRVLCGIGVDLRGSLVIRQRFLRHRFLFTGLIFLVIGVILTRPVLAVTEEMLQNVFAPNNILFYDPGEGCVSLYSTSVGGNSNGSDVLVIGDSISTPVYAGDEIQEALPNAIIDAVGSSGINYDSGEILSGITRLKNNLDLLNSRGVLVFAMGTNGGVRDSDINALLETVSGKNIKIILMTLFNPADSTIASSNETVKKTAEEYENITYMDWYTVASQDPDKYVAKEPAMQVHPTKEGSLKFAEIMKEAVNKVTSLRTGAANLDGGHYYGEYSEKWGDLSGFDHWDGSCSNMDSYDSFLSKRADTLIAVAAETGVPWETLAAQSIVESGGEVSAVAMKCNNPLGLTTSSVTKCPYVDGNGVTRFYYQDFATFEDAYRAYGENTWIIKRAMEVGNFASSPFSLIEYMQYGESSAYAMCGADSELYPNCKGHEGEPTPGYVTAASKMICGIQKWAVEHGKPISEENFTNYDSPYRTIMADGTVDGSKIITTGSGRLSNYCNDSPIYTNGNGVTLFNFNGFQYAFPIGQATKENFMSNSNSALLDKYGSYDTSCVSSGSTWISCLSQPDAWYHHDYNSAVDLGIVMEMVDGLERSDKNTDRHWGGDSTQTDKRYYLTSGAPVVAAIDGTITFTKDTYVASGVPASWESKCGSLVLTGVDGNRYSYIHISSESIQVEVGQSVKVGQVLAEVGAPYCAQSTQAHLHFQVNDKDDDIRPLIRQAYANLPANADELAKREAAANEAKEGGLTYEQAKQFMINYGANKNNSSLNATGEYSWNMCGGGGSNCVTFSNFFLNKFTSTSGDDLPNGKDVVDTLRARGAETGESPRVWAVFSWDGGEYGHTGVILGYHDGKWIVGHASCTRGNNGKRGAGDGTLDGGGAGVVEMNSDALTAIWGGSATNVKYAYFDSEVNLSAINSYLSNGV